MQGVLQVIRRRMLVTVAKRNGECQQHTGQGRMHARAQHEIPHENTGDEVEPQTGDAHAVKHQQQYVNRHRQAKIGG